MGRKLKEHRLPLSAMITVPNYYFLRVVQVNHHCTLTEALNIVLSEAGAKYALDNYDDEEDQPEPVQEEPKKPEPKAEPVKAAPKKTAKPIDKGKIGALRKAGWTVAEIADEMKCSNATVYKVLNELKEATK